MKRNILNSLIMLLPAIILFACKPKQTIIKPPVAAEPAETVKNEKPANLQMLKAKDLAFNTLSLKGKANLQLDGDDNNVTMQIRMEKDSRIWVSITAIAGIEVARALVTPDSIWLRNNLERTYLRKPFSYLYKFTNKQITFQWLQAVLAGNTIPDFMNEQSDLEQVDGIWILSGTRNNLAYRSVFNTLQKVQETTLNDVLAAQAFKVNYTNYTAIAGGLFPSALKINSMSGTKKLSLEINFTKAESNVTVDFPFSVPKSYTLLN